MGQEPDVVQGLRSLYGRGGFDLSDDQLAELVPEIERHRHLANFLRGRVLLSDEPATIFIPAPRQADRLTGAGETDATR